MQKFTEPQRDLNMSKHRLISQDEVLRKLDEFDAFLARARYDAQIEDFGILNTLLDDVRGVSREIRHGKSIE